MIVLLGLSKQGGGGICVDQHAVLFFTSCGRRKQLVKNRKGSCVNK